MEEYILQNLQLAFYKEYYLDDSRPFCPDSSTNLYVLFCE